MGNKQLKNKKPKFDDINITDNKIKDINRNDNKNHSKGYSYIRKISEEYLINKNSLKNIKSKYITILVFSYIKEKRKLEIIKYNKNIQNLLDIKIINYKFNLRKSLIYELNGNVKEYNEYYDYLGFEGEYLNGKRNGKGKEYNYDGSLYFVGEYLNGKRNGKGKEYDYFSQKIIFEGEYRNGLRWNGKGYDNNNNVVY